MSDDYMSEADNEVDGGYFADLEYSYQQKEIRRQEDKENKAKKEENRKQQLLRQNKCIENLKIKINKLKHQLAEKDKELLEFKKDRLYFELLLTRLQWLHKRADEYKKEEKRFGIDEEMSLSSVWDVLELQKNDLCEYEEMVALQEGIECIANSKLLADIEHDLQVKATRNENEIFKDIEQIDQQIKELKGEKDVED